MNQSRSEAQRAYNPSNTTNSSSSSNNNYRYFNQSANESERRNYVNTRREPEESFYASFQDSSTSHDTNGVNNSSYTNNDNSSEMKNLLINPRMIDRLRKLIRSHPDGIWCSELHTKYLNTYSATLNYSDLGFDSVSHFASSLPNIFHCVQLEESGDYKLYNAENPPPVIKKVKRVIENDSNNQDTINNNVSKRSTALPNLLVSV